MAIGDLELENLDEKTKLPPKTRIKDAAAVRELYVKMVSDDNSSQAKRNEVQSMLDGKPPYDANVLAATGQGGITNQDFGEGEAIHEAGVTAMLDIVNSVENLVVIPLKKNAVADEEARRNFEEILASEASRTIREWDAFDFSYQALVGLWFDHGIGINYFEDSYNWQWEVSGLGDFVIPRRTRASESKIPYAGCRRGYQLHEIWAKVEDEETATSAGWNVEAVKDAMLRCSSSADSGVRTWEDVETGLRNNDYSTSGKATELKVIHMWVKQFNGSVSLYLVPEEGPSGFAPAKEAFLFESHGVYRSMREAFTFFCYGIGTNRTYHGVVGQMHKIYPMIQYGNRMMGKFLDAAAMGASLMLQPENESDLGNLALVTYANYTILPAAATMKVVEHAAPNLSQNLIPAIDVMKQMLDRRAGQVDLQAPYNNQEKTAMEIRTTLGQQARVGQSQLSLFIPPWGRHLREVVRRLCRPDYDISLPGGEEANQMRARLVEQGFPLELLAGIDFEAVTCTQAVGAGSPAVRAAAMSELETMAAGYDAVGQHNFKRDKTAAALRSYKAADRYIPKLPGDVRPPMDKQIALLESSLMSMGQTVEVVVNQMHTVHLDTQLPDLMNDVEQAEQDERFMVEKAQTMAVKHDHCVQHLEAIQMDPTIQEKTAMYRQALQQAGEIIGNAQKKADKMMREQQEAGGEGQEAGGMDAQTAEKMAAMVEQNNLKLQIMSQQAELKAAIRLQEFHQKMALRDADNASRMIAAQRLQNAKKSA